VVIVSLPIFLVHWRVVERDAARDSEEQNSRLRALFLYTARFATLLPAVHSLLAIINRNLMVYLGRSGSEAMVGYGQTLADNGIAIAVNMAAWIYINQILSKDWQARASTASLEEIRRIYRYAWVIYALSLTVMGVQQVLGFMLFLPKGEFSPVGAFLGNGLAFIIIGVPLFLQVWLTVQRSLDEPAENLSNLRLIVLYLISLIGAITFLISSGAALAEGFRWALGQAGTLRIFLDSTGDSISVAIPFAVVWAYFHAQLHAGFESEGDVLRRTNLRRPYRYILSLAGSATVFFGTWCLLAAIVEILSGGLVRVEAMRGSIADGLAMLVIGLPLWLIPWQSVQDESNQSNDIGDHSRRSVMRKGYLYLGVFATVIGIMVAAGMLFYLVFTRLLEGKADNFIIISLQRLSTVLLVIIWFYYHLRVLLHDGKIAHKALGNRHAVFSVLIFESENETFATDLVDALKRQAPRLPVYVHKLNDSLGEVPADYKAVVMSSDIALNPPEALRTWLKEYEGRKLMAPVQAKNWYMPGMILHPQPEAAKETALALRQMAEGMQVRVSGFTNPWVVVGIVLGIFFGIPLLLSLIGMLLYI